MAKCIVTSGTIEIVYEDVKVFGRKLKQQREQKGKTLKQMSADIGWWHWCIDNWENGEGVSLETIEKLSSYFGVPVDYLLSPHMEEHYQLSLF